MNPQGSTLLAPQPSVTPNVHAPRVLALIPARAGSQRVPGKNMKLLAGIPLLTYTIRAAHDSRIFSNIVVSTDDSEAAQLATQMNCHVHHRDPRDATAESPDIAWVTDVLRTCGDEPAFAILRPTSPFRSPQMIRRAWDFFLQMQPCDSLRAVRPVTEHPAKMWRRGNGSLIEPYEYQGSGRVPRHSQPTQNLGEVFVQTSSLEIAWQQTVIQTASIAGRLVLPYVVSGLDAFAIDTPEDWAEAERIAATEIGARVAGE